MSLDETLEQMEHFYRALREFNDQLMASTSALARSHAAIDPLWRDSFRKEYDAIWNPFVDTMALYLNREAPNYAQFLHDRLYRLRAYLHGD